MSDQAASMQPSKEERQQNARQTEQQQQQQPRAAGSSSSGGGGRSERGGRRRHGQQQNQPRRPEAAINMEEMRELVKLIADHGFTDFELEREGFRVRLRRELAPVMTSSTNATGHQSASHASELQISTGEMATAREGGATSQAVAPSHPGAEAERAASADEDLHIITSPIVGTFYRAASPTSEPFAKIGSRVDPDTVVCIIEAMKLMNEIQAETSGEIAKIYVENGQPVEYGQPLFGIKQ